MKSHFVSSTAIVVGVFVLAFSSVLFAQTAARVGSGNKPIARTPDGQPDLSGVWGAPDWDSDPTTHAPAAPQNPANREPVPYQKWAEEKYRYGKDPFNDRMRIELDPTNRCFPPPPTQLMSNRDPFEIILTPGRVLLISEFNREVRQIWMNEQHPPDLDLSWMGHSVGKWDGDTLVVDTVAVDDRNSWGGFVHTDALHVVERIRRVDQVTLEIVMTIEDTKAYTKPWTRTIVRKLRPGWRITPSILCDERYKTNIYGDTL